MADTTRLEAFLAAVDKRSRRSLRAKLEANIGDPAIRRHVFTEMLVDGGGSFAEYTSAERSRGGIRITIHGPVLHRVDGAVWAPEEATPAAQQYARWLIASRPGGAAYMSDLTASERQAMDRQTGVDRG